MPPFDSSNCFRSQHSHTLLGARRSSTLSARRLDTEVDAIDSEGISTHLGPRSIEVVTGNERTAVRSWYRRQSSETWGSDTSWGQKRRLRELRLDHRSTS